MKKLENKIDIKKSFSHYSVYRFYEIFIVFSVFKANHF